jgi:hypothetical protein
MLITHRDQRCCCGVPPAPPSPARHHHVHPGVCAVGIVGLVLIDVFSSWVFISSCCLPTDVLLFSSVMHVSYSTGQCCGDIRWCCGGAARGSATQGMESNHVCACPLCDRIQAIHIMQVLIGTKNAEINAEVARLGTLASLLVRTYVRMCALLWLVIVAHDKRLCCPSSPRRALNVKILCTSLLWASESCSMMR